ncbi:hypothetical protein AnigIFM59636_000513 [Aspergillus niger]|nr:hypothetical protein AnigIFM59636_000513 [Aspergillus niger]
MIKGEARGVAKYSRRHVEKIGWDLNEHFAYFLHNSVAEDTDITDVSPERLWKGLYHRKIKYPKATVLYWKLMLNKMRTEEP